MIADIYEAIDLLGKKITEEKDESKINPFLPILKLKLEAFVKNPRADVIKSHISFVKATLPELTTEANKALFRDILDLLTRMQKNYEAMKRSLKSDRRPEIYKQAIKFGATVMLPMQQDKDLRWELDRGLQCQGMTSYWAKRYLEGKPISGIYPEGDLTFPPITTEDGLKQYYDINSLLPAESEIQSLQKEQEKHSIAHRASHQKLFGLFSFRSSSTLIDAYPLSLDAKEQSKFIIQDITRNNNIEFKDAGPIAAGIVEASKTDPEKCQRKTYHLTLLGDGPGHSIVFGIDLDSKGKIAHIHCVDPNSGWYRFTSPDDFIKWFQYYFKEMGYEKKRVQYIDPDTDIPEYKTVGFYKYTMYSYSLDKKFQKTVDDDVKNTKTEQDSKLKKNKENIYSKDDLATTQRQPEKKTQFSNDDISLHHKRNR